MTQPASVGKEHKIIEFIVFCFLTIPCTCDDSDYLHIYFEPFKQPYPWFFHRVCFRKLSTDIFKMYQEIGGKKKKTAWQRLVSHLKIPINLTSDLIYPMHHLLLEIFFSYQVILLTYQYSKISTFAFKCVCKFGNPLRQNGNMKEAKLSAGENTEQLEVLYSVGNSVN